ncbi:MAG TPA: sulfatase-like hydrolase/transferase [Polyangiaceae bacterium]|nr:sulfatase-like hydrolase/transferase [Polyangiaceae bacterium]
MKWVAVGAALALFGRCEKSDPEAVPSAHPAPSAAPRADVRTPSLDLVSMLPGCDVEHEGLFLDVGTPAVESRRDHSAGPFRDTPVYERASATFARVHSRRLAYDFALTAPLKRASVTLRAVGVVSRQVSVYLDDRRVGLLGLSREEPTIVATEPLEELRPGPHVVTLRFGGGAQGADDPYAEVDWIRIGPPTQTPRSYAPPTLRDVVTDVVLDGEPRRSIVLRGPGAVRCPLRVSVGMHLDASVGFWGSGSGTATISVIEDGEAPSIVAEKQLVGGTGGRWERVSVDLEKFAGRVVGLELSSSAASGGGRVAFGEPRVAGPRGDVPAPPAKVVVLVVGSGLDRRLIPPWGRAADLPTISKLARDGVAFDRYRTPTTVAASVMASLLTGLPPRSHGLEDPFTRLPEDVRLVSERAAEVTAHAAFFTAVPSTFPPFGFDRGWDRFEAFSPVRDVAATEPYAQGVAWLKDQLATSRDGKLLLVVHARGGHPPWDVTRDEVSQLPPEEYSGPIEPRAGAIVLANLRAVRGADTRLSGDDWRRLHALEGAALRKEDGALRRVIEVLEKEGLYDKSLVVFMGDVATGDPPGIPFGPAPPLREDNLLAPLIVKFPGGALAGTSSSVMATTTDVAVTVFHALGLDDQGATGSDLFQLAKNGVPLDGHAVMATLGVRYSTRWGPWLLSGEFGRRPTLCLVDVDPSCVTDAYAQSPFSAAALWRRTYEIESAARAARDRSREAARADLDPDTQAALRVYGY